MWKVVENGNLARPAEVDSASSRAYVFLRRNITLVPEERDGEEVVTPEHYRWEETKVPQDVWNVAEKVFGHDAALDDVYAALTELAEMIVEG